MTKPDIVIIDNDFIRAVVKKKRSFYGQADRKGGEGGVSPLGPDRKQM